MSNSETDKPEIRITFTDGDTLDSSLIDSATSGEENISNMLNGLASAVNSNIYARTGSDLEYTAAKAALDATPWYRFKKRRELAERASKLHTAAFQTAIKGMLDGMEIIDVENDPNVIDS
jgi:hypothetical protein